MTRFVSHQLLLTTVLLFGWLVFGLSSAPSAFAQEKPATAAHIESAPDLILQLTPVQKQQLDEAKKAFGAKQYANAMVSLKLLLTQIPGDAFLSKFASEAALNAGDTKFALNTLMPVTLANPEDWQATALLTRACAEGGDLACRDEGIAHMLQLHQRGVTPPNVQRYIVEKVKIGTNTVLIWPSLEPWGEYKVYDLGQVFDDQSHIFLHITIESNDADQIRFAKEHPEEASKGTRLFTLDAYRDTGLNASGQRTQTHYTYKFLTGQPSYQTVREEFIGVATGKSKPISSRTNLIAP